MASVTQDSTTIKRLRLGIGLVGIWLPFVVTIGHSVNVGRFTLPSSISGAYYTSMRDVFVGSMSAVGVFLIFYRTSRAADILGTIAGLAAIAVALFPAKSGAADLMVSSADAPGGVVHTVAAAVLFLSLAAFCFFLFPQSSRPPRKVVYYVSGLVIILGFALALLGSRILPDDVEATVHPLFWGETVAIIAFGVAWFTKSNAVMPDPRES
ncbi:MAG TPA: hypothetical protein VFC19_23115 [Candidatus Limnocylindrales bacterium]|nr:hypothetical protein [Candidatus Limnocylindrales bacterium]